MGRETWQIFADEEVGTELRKWLRQNSKELHVAGFDALVKRWENCILTRRLKAGIVHC
jgi:hypothetical protein